MTTAASPLPIDESPQTVPWRRALLALLPLAFLGLMPWGICLGLSAVILIGLRFPAWGSGRLLLFLFVIAVGALVQVPGAWNSGAGPGLLIALASGYLLQLLLVFLLHFSLIMLEEGQRRGLLLVLLPALFAPQWGLVPALLGACWRVKAPTTACQVSGRPRSVRCGSRWPGPLLPWFFSAHCCRTPEYRFRKWRPGRPRPPAGGNLLGLESEAGGQWHAKAGQAGGERALYGQVR
ncbi:hypothetical protein MSS93_12190 [Deinococcus radiodurans]|nr:hypothetical protein MSS93_12190 [Deinococcus radiodurans]